jgi:lysine decarboxylase
MEQVRDPYASDASISHESLGYPSDPSGLFKTAYETAAVAYGADHTLFSVNGTTGSNFIVLRALSKQIPNLRVLAQRNVHRSVVAASEDYGINLMFLRPNVDKDHHLFLPNTAEQVYEGVSRTKPQVLLLTNPTYEGACLDLRGLLAGLRERYPNLIVFVDEAWGAHLAFSDQLPACSMDAGADICVQSTHKQGGSLQQSGMIHWKDGRINPDLLLDSYRSLATSSPSYLLLASLDAARQMMETRGRSNIERMLTIADCLTDYIGAIEGVEVVTTDQLKRKHPSVFERDETKIIVDVAKTGISGFDVAKQLELKYNIVVEAYNLTTLLLLVPFRATIHDVQTTALALHEIVASMRDRQAACVELEIPTDIPRILELGEVTKLLSTQIESVCLREAAGRIAAEHITPFPPGIPMTIKGEEMTPEIIEYYEQLKAFPNVHVAARDKSLETVWVVK